MFDAFEIVTNMVLDSEFVLTLQVCERYFCNEFTHFD